MSLGTIPAREGEREYAEAVQEALSEKSRLLGRAMSYRDFTLEELEQRFALGIDERSDVFASLPRRQVSALLHETLQENLPLAVAMSNERARAELVISPVLLEMRRQLGGKISLFYGWRFMVDEEQGLAGFPDYLLSLSPKQLTLQEPVLVVVEVKDEDLSEALPQCMAAMVAAQLFNQRAGMEPRSVYGAVTSGSIWRFLCLSGSNVTIDLTEFYIDEVDRIVGILVHMLRDENVRQNKTEP